MDKWIKNTFIILIISLISSACSIDMIAGKDDGPGIKRDATLNIVPAFRTNLSLDADPRLSEQFATKNKTALFQLDANIRQLNQLNPSIRHTLVTEYNDSDFKYTDYIQNWKSRLERYGNSKYPKGLNYKTPNGNALVDVAITRSGRLYSYKIIANSGSRKLTAAVKYILDHNRLFSPLSPSIQKDTDVLHITQMWQFRQ